MQRTNNPTNEQEKKCGGINPMIFKVGLVVASGVLLIYSVKFAMSIIH